MKAENPGGKSSGFLFCDDSRMTSPEVIMNENTEDMV